jgi:Zn-finger nucleic acid-binding protein
MCPACQEPLVVYELEGVEIDHCLKCRGTWLDAGELQQIAELAGAAPGKLEAALAEGGGEKHGSRRCVRCRGRLRVAGIQGVEIDRCPRGHGLWFDRGEMKTLVSTFEGEDGAAARFFGDLLRSELKGG